MTPYQLGKRAAARSIKRIGDDSGIKTMAGKPPMYGIREVPDRVQRIGGPIVKNLRKPRNVQTIGPQRQEPNGMQVGHRMLNQG